MSLKFDDLEKEYADLFSRMSIKSGWDETVNRTVQKILDNKVRYRTIEDQTGVPWAWIGCVHAMESGVRFSTHLHNGDSLTARTRRVPAGRPKNGKPPFTWEESAIDALFLKGLQNVSDWSLPRMLYEFERYNGWGYRLYHHATLSPYLWSGSPLYRKGKYVKDWKYDPDAVSKQTGAAVLLYRLAEMDPSVDLAVDDRIADAYDVPGEDVPVPDPAPEALVPESFPRAEEPRVTEAVKKSRTITGALTAAFGSVVAWFESVLDVLMETGSKVVEFAPAQMVLSSMVGNFKAIGMSLTVAGLILVISRRLNAAQKGKIG